MTDKETAEVIALCSQWWPNFRAPESLPTMVRSWSLMLRDVPFAAAQAALAEHSASGAEFPPPVGVIRRRAAQLVMPAGRAPSVDEAWENVREQIARVGLTPTLLDKGARKPEFIHPAVAAVVAAIGWKELCESTNVVADRAHFAKMYAERIERDVQAAAEPPAVGAVRSAAAAAAVEAGEPVRVGDLLPMRPVQR